MSTRAQEDPNDPAFRMWCRRQWNLLREGGQWIVPRSGLVFEKRDGALWLIVEMPWTHALDGVVTAEQLREQQDDEYETIRRFFAAEGIDVEKALT